MNRDRKILIIIPGFQLGGTNTSLENLLNHLSLCSIGHQIDLFALSSFGPLRSRFTNYNIIKSNKILNFWFSSFLDFNGMDRVLAIFVRAIRKISELLKFDVEGIILKLAACARRLNRYEIVIGYQEGAPTRLAFKLSAEKRIAWVHCNLLYSNYIFDLYRKAYNIMDDVVCVSESAKQIFDSLYPDCVAKSKVVYNIIDTKRINALAAHKDKNMSKFSSVTKLISIGRLDPVKQFHIIPSIAAKIKESKRDFVWFIVGSGSEEYKNKILEEIRKYGVEDNVIMLGYQGNPYSILSDTDVYVCTSVSEACPMVFLEANALGKYIISNDFPSAHEILSPDIGMICTISDMADKITKYVSSKKSTVPIEKKIYKDYKTSIESLLEI